MLWWMTNLLSNTRLSKDKIFLLIWKGKPLEALPLGSRKMVPMKISSNSSILLLLKWRKMVHLTKSLRNGLVVANLPLQQQPPQVLLLFQKRPLKQDKRQLLRRKPTRFLVIPLLLPSSSKMIKVNTLGLIWNWLRPLPKTKDLP